MIKFYGFMDNSSRVYIQKKLIKNGFIGAGVMFLLLGVPSVLAWIYWRIWVFIFLPIVGTPIMIIGSALSVNSYLPKKVTIDEKEIYAEYQKGAGVRSINDVKEVLDMGAFYHIIFYFPNHWSNCVCQKNLIVEGTIEEFEKLFEDKIVRKYETK